MRVLVVGAGSVGVVYAHLLRRGGAEVAFFVKPAHQLAVQAGIELHELKLGRAAAAPVRLEGVPTFTAWPDVGAAGPWDWVILTIPPPALRAPGFAEGLKAALGPQTAVLCLVMGLGDEDWLAGLLGPGRLASGEIVLISYSLPLEGGSAQHPLATAFFIPPIGAAPMSGLEPSKLAPLAAAFTRGGMPCEGVKDSHAQSRLPGALLFALVSALHLVEWRFAALGGSDALHVGLAAAREREAVLTRSGAGEPPMLLALAWPGLLRLVLWAATKVLPLPLEAYLRVHFTKVNAQFVVDRKRLIAAGRELGLATPSLEALHRRLG